MMSLRSVIELTKQKDRQDDFIEVKTSSKEQEKEKEANRIKQAQQEIKEMELQIPDGYPIYDEDKTKSVFLSGMLDDDVFFHTVFLRKDGKYSPVVLTSKGDELEVIDRYKELRKTGMKDKEIQPEDRYFYFRYDDCEYKYVVEDLSFKDAFRINTVDSGVLGLIREKKFSKEIYDETKSKIWNYWDHHNQYEYDIQIVNCIETYLIRAFGKTFYQVLQGKEDTGKSTLQKVLSKLQFNGIFGGKGTVPFNVRLNHYLGCSINQDEFEKMGEQDKKTFIGVANTGLYADGTYNIVDVNKKKLVDQLTSLNTFSKKTFSTNSLKQFDKSFMSRCYVLIGTRQGRKVKDINDLSQEEIWGFQLLRNKIFSYSLFNWKAIKDSVKEIKEELEAEGTFGRKTDMNSIILGIIKHFKGEYYKEVKKHLKEKEGLSQEEKSLTNEYLMFEYFVEKLLDEDKLLQVSNKDIVEYVSSQRNLDEVGKKKLSRTVGWIIKNNDLVRSKANVKRGKSGARAYIIEKLILTDTLRRFGYTDLLKKLNGETTFRNGRNGKNGISSTVSEVSTVSEGGLGNGHIKEESILEDPKSEVLEYIKQNPRDNAIQMDEKFSPKLIKKMIEQGDIMENPRGTYRTVE